MYIYITHAYIFKYLYVYIIQSDKEGDDNGTTDKLIMEMMNIHSWSGISRRPYAKSRDDFALWIFFDSLFVWFKQQDVSCFTISLVMFLQEIRNESTRNFKNHPPTSPTKSFSTGSCLWGFGAHCDASGWSPVASSRKLEWRLWQHIPAWPKPSLSFLSTGRWVGRWVGRWWCGRPHPGDGGRWWCDPKKT